MNETLDLRGLKCPMPALLARKALARIAPGAMLTVLADDPLATVDIPHMCNREGHAVQGVTRRDSHNEFIVQARLADAHPSA